MTDRFASRIRLPLAALFAAALVASCASEPGRSDALADSGRALFDGESLDGWHAIGGGEWMVVGGSIEGRASREEPAHGLLVSDEEFADFEVTFEYLVLEGDSGFYFRVEETGDSVGVRGFQVEVDDVEPGGLYETGGRAWVVKHAPEAAAEWHRSGEWNRVRLLAVGEHIEVHVNGVAATVLDDPGCRRSGRFALQLHGGQDMHVRYRNIRLLDR